MKTIFTYWHLSNFSFLKIMVIFIYIILNYYLLIKRFPNYFNSKYLLKPAKLIQINLNLINSIRIKDLNFLSIFYQ